MNVLRRIAAFVHAMLLELLLVLSIVLLVVQISWPRLSQWWRLPSAGQIGLDRIEAATLSNNYVVYLPPSYHSADSWPLVVFLHGSGERGTDPTTLRRRGPLAQGLPAIVVAPQCLPESHWDTEVVARFVEHVASRYHVDRERIYLVGFSMGGYGVWRSAAANPRLFAAFVPIAGGGEPDDANVLAGIPVWAFHGANDKVVPVLESEQMVEAIRSAGGRPQLAILPEAGHGTCQTVCNRTDLWEWLFQQRRK